MSTDRAAPAGGASPLLGFDFAWATCAGGSTPYIVTDYGRAGVRANLVPALHAMRAAGVESVALYIWSRHEPTWEIPSAEGRLTEPYRTNLIRLLSDIRSAGFEQVTAVFQPRGSNDMKSWTGDYDPALFDENWSFIRDVRSLVKEYGPASTRINLLGEGAPDNWERSNKPLWWNDLTRMYRNYVEAFGYEDVTISAIASSMMNLGNTANDVERMQNLIDLLRASGKPLPTWFALSISYGAEALDDLRAVDEVLSRNGLSQPLVIQESAYNSAEVAGAVATFVSSSRRPLLELDEWPLYGPESINGKPVVPPPRCASLPFVVDAYARALRGGRSTTLHASVGPEGRVSLLTPYGQPVKALLRGKYTIVVGDMSARHGFRLYGEFVERRTGIRFKGTRTWNVTFRSTGLLGAPYTYASLRPGGRHEHFSVLVPG